MLIWIPSNPVIELVASNLPSSGSCEEGSVQASVGLAVRSSNGISSRSGWGSLSSPIQRLVRQPMYEVLCATTGVLNEMSFSLLVSSYGADQRRERTSLRAEKGGKEQGWNAA